MFEARTLSQVAPAAGVDDAAVVDEMTAAAREENAACARRLAWLGELWALRAPEGDTERQDWAIDGFANVVAEAGAALGISRGRAAGQLHYAIALRERLPKVASLMATGAIDFRIMAAIVSRTDNVDDPEQITRLDAALARHAVKWTRFSQSKLIERIDMWVARVDPAGVRLPREARDGRYVEFWARRDGTADLSGRLGLTDSVVVDDRLDQLAATVCPDDPRTREQRRADALVALAAGAERLPCRCGAAECVLADEKPSAEVIIHVLAEQATVDGTSPSPGYVPGQGPLPAEAVRELATTAKLKPLPRPADEPEPDYRPSKALAAFVRARDLTCRFPNCDQPAECCDIDHTIPYPTGPTHPSNLKCMCRHHHLLKTFWTGLGGWADRQLPDGTVIWTAPTGHTYTTTPGGALFFPTYTAPTAKLVIPESSRPPDLNRTYRGVMMPRRKQTREHERRYQISRERRINEARIVEEHRKRWARVATSNEPPPF